MCPEVVVLIRPVLVKCEHKLKSIAAEQIGEIEEVVTEDCSRTVEGREPGLISLVVPEQRIKETEAEEVGPVAYEEHPRGAAADRPEVSSGLQQASHH